MSWNPKARMSLFSKKGLQSGTWSLVELSALSVYALHSSYRSDFSLSKARGGKLAYVSAPEFVCFKSNCLKENEWINLCKSQSQIPKRKILSWNRSGAHPGPIRCVQMASYCTKCCKGLSAMNEVRSKEKLLWIDKTLQNAADEWETILCFVFNHNNNFN